MTRRSNETNTTGIGEHTLTCIVLLDSALMVVGCGSAHRKFRRHIFDCAERVRSEPVAKILRESWIQDVKQRSQKASYTADTEKKTVVMFMSKESIVCGANLDSDVMLRKNSASFLLKSFSPNTDPIQLR